MNLQKYFDFIDSCKIKTPEKYHKHHIIPKYMGGSNDKNNLINLSYEDHYIAHIVLADCFEAGSYHYNRNIWSALKLSDWKNDENLSAKLSLARKGKTYEELFGEDTALIAKEKLKKHWSIYWAKPENRERQRNLMIELNPMNGFLFSEKQLRKMSEARKKWWSNLSENDLNLIKEKRSLLSKKFWQEFRLDGDKFESYREKMSQTLKDWWNKNLDSEKIKGRNKKISESQKGVAKNVESVKKWKETVEENKTFAGDKNSMFGRKHNDETKEKIRQKALGRPGNRLGKTFSSFKFYLDGTFVYEAKGQIEARSFCKEKNISFQTLCKKGNTWKNWYCERNKIKKQ
jgi:hypothetical protein